MPRVATPSADAGPPSPVSILSVCPIPELGKRVLGASVPRLQAPELPYFCTDASAQTPL